MQPALLAFHTLNLGCCYPKQGLPTLPPSLPRLWPHTAVDLPHWKAEGKTPWEKGCPGAVLEAFGHLLTTFKVPPITATRGRQPLAQ